MRKLAATLCLLAACYRTTEWGSTGEFRGHATHTSEQEVDKKQTAAFDDKNGLIATVTEQGMCRPLLLGENLEEKQEATSTLAHPGTMIVTSLLVGIAGAVGILLAIEDINNQDFYGNPLPPRFSSTTHTYMIVGGSALTLLGAGGVVATILMPSAKHHQRWVPVEGNPTQVVTSEEPQPCQTPAAPVAGVKVTVEAKFAKGATLSYDVVTGADGTVKIDLATLRAVAGWCGVGQVTAKVLDQTWDSALEGTPGPVAQIQDDKARDVATGCGGK